ncbi:patatin-like phospholipase family protein [Rhodoligotrophos defluvii]|uniref:patatin-like phospholipase family protein n=1 Tax=Rhodoligotrophos defluvii TaxID=2561934 RepID=UPI00148566DA|nr:patatin-like phospholipase family protein [Rhodoligotrophos defluvii]
MAAGAPQIGLALGGGGARGLAHIAILEAFDELGIKPARVAGTSIGALIGAVYAGGLSALEIRAHAERVLVNRRELIRRILADPEVNLRQLFGLRSPLGAAIDGRVLVRAALPPGMPERIEDFPIPFTAVATDFYGRRVYPLLRGPVVPALAASIALPGLISPQRLGNVVLVDGGITNPLPFDLLHHVDIVVAVDVTGRPISRPGRMPSMPELLFRSSMIMQHHLVQANIERSPPDILVVPEVDEIRVLEFFRLPQIMKAAQPAKEEVKRKLEALLRGRPARRRRLSPPRSSAARKRSAGPGYSA